MLTPRYDDARCAGAVRLSAHDALAAVARRNQSDRNSRRAVYEEPADERLSERVFFFEMARFTYRFF